MTERAVLIGTFDGVHRGHQALIRAGRELVGMSGEVVVCTFHPHPRAVVGSGSPRMLLSLGRRVRLLESAGADVVRIIDFTPELARTSPGDFIHQYLVELNPSRVIVGSNFRFGQGARGSIADLVQAGERYGWSAEALELVQLHDGGEHGLDAVSASRIRALVRMGNVAAASELIGRPHELDGPVVRGAQRGRALGMPTANLGLDPGRAVPAEGVYAGWAHVRGETHPCAISVGTNPQFTSNDAAPPLTVEAHLLDFDDDIYDEPIRIEFVARLRGQATFDSVDLLIVAMQDDLVSTRNALALS